MKSPLVWVLNLGDPPVEYNTTIGDKDNIPDQEDMPEGSH